MRRGREIDFHFPPILRKLKRGPQILLPKDLGMISAFAGIGKDSVVIDAGTGSAYAAVFFANIAKKVITYEQRKEFIAFARKNITRSGLDNIILRNKNIFKGAREKVDVIVLDLPNPEKIFASKFNLREGGYIVAYSPNMEQVKAFVMKAEKKGYATSTVRCIVEELLVRDFGTRPANTGLMHTGYLIFTKKMTPKENQQKLERIKKQKSRKRNSRLK